jgi:hypothetical protein
VAKAGFNLHQKAARHTTDRRWTIDSSTNAPDPRSKPIRAPSTSTYTLPIPTSSNLANDVATTPKKLPKSKRGQHPLGINTVFNSHPLPMQEANESIYIHIQGNAAALRWNSVSVETQKQYGTPFRRYTELITAMGTNLTMTEIPMAFYRTNPTMTFQETVIVGYMTYLRSNRDCCPNTIMSYVSGLIFYLKNMNVDTSFVADSRAIAESKKGIFQLWRAQPGNNAADSARVPFSADMIIRTITECLTSGSRKDLALGAAMKFGLTFLARASEYLKSNETTRHHHITGKDVVFEVSLPSGTTKFVSASKVKHYPFTAVRKLVVTLRDSKNDPDGSGHRFPYVPRPKSQFPNDLYCIVQSMYECACSLQPGDDDPFFSCPIENWHLTADDMSETLKKGAKLYGFNEQRFAPHSLRIAGASAMAANGAPNWLIQLAGRWRTDQFLKYIRLSTEAFQQSITAISSCTVFNSDDIRM